MKKIFAMILAMVLLCSTLVACGGSSYSDLAIVDLGFEKEYFGIAFRAGSDMTRKVEDITLQLIEDGTLATLSETYEVGAVGKGEYTPAADPCTDSGDWAYIQGKGTLIVGITEFAPMDYPDENGEWIGFDADMARKVAEKLGVEIEFVVIDWDNKIMELDSKNIDVVWNGMTLTDEVKAAMECTNAYCNNAQVVVVPAK